MYKVVSVVDTIAEPILQAREDEPHELQISLNIPNAALPDKGFKIANGNISTISLLTLKYLIIMLNKSSKKPLALIIDTANNIPNIVGNTSLNKSKPSLDPVMNNSNAFFFFIIATNIVNIINAGKIILISNFSSK